MENRFGAFKTSLCECLTIEDCRRLCAYFEVLSAKTDSILNSKPQGLVLLNELEEQGQIKSTDIHNLSGAFKHLKMDRLAKEVEDYENSHGLSESSTLPEDLGSDEDIDESEDRPRNMSFEEFKTMCGLKETLTLKKMLEVKSPGRTATRAELFWETITSLDYRITSSEITKDLSVRDLVFAILHCSNKVLRQDIIAKMTSCQLAVPLVLNGVNNSKPVLLYWAFRTIRKKIQTLNDTDPIERPMYKHETFTVSFLRVGNIRFSKSDLLNSLLSECQGNHAHSFYISRKGDLAKPSFSNGSIEVVWYVPEAGDKGILESTTAFLNLRGDSQEFQFQTEFLCKVSNLTFVLIGKQNWKVYKGFLENIQKMAANVLVLAIRETDDEKADKYLNFRHESVIGVQKLHMTVLNEEICSRINKLKQTHPKLWSLENFKDHAQGILEVDISNEYLARIKGKVESIVPKQVDITQFKSNILRLFPIWVEWVGLDEMTFTTESGIEHQRATREGEKISKRKQQLATNISQEVKAFWDLLRLVGCKSDLFDDCLIYLQTLLFELTHMRQGCSKSAQKFLTDRLSEKVFDVKLEMEGARKNLNEVYSNETKNQWQMSIGVEDFMRELGQLFEASLQCGGDETKLVDVMRLPALAARFIANGNSLEMLDDKSYCVPVCWVMNILEELNTLLGERAKVLVLSVIGIQGSGKSTLLNTMFGTKFPVSAGRCTRGLFLRLLKVEESFAGSIGCNYIIVVDTEGLKGDHGALDEACSTRLDNKMVTLAMCIADLIIVNIEGETIGSDMTNFLQIAAYALIRMKEVDLQSQCRIIQQRVSDITASAKNKTNMLKIISNLDKAVKNVAETEGFVDRYESFSDIFKLNVNDHTQYVCNLWSGNMNPPNHLYGKVVIKFKEEVFDTISSGKLKVHFTLKTFGGRLLAVHEALKEENFVLKFEDVSRAITYNEFSLQCNNWLCDVRVKVKASWLAWQRRMGTAESYEREKLCETFKDELAEEMGKHRNTINKQFQSYIQNNKNARSFYNKYFSSWIEASLSKIECDIQIKISNEAKALKWAARDIPSFILKEAQRIRLKAIEKANSLRGNVSEQVDPSTLQRYFDEYWENAITFILETFQSKRVSDKNIVEECTRILIDLCNGNAIESDVVRLLEKEGNILTHSLEFNSESYIANKTMTEKILEIPSFQKFLGKREKIKEDITAVVQRVKTSTIAQFITDCHGKSFDPYLIYTTLQTALSDITFGEDVRNLKVPTSLIAKVLLHLCGTVSEIAIKNDKKYHINNSCQDLFEKHKTDIYLDFNAFYRDSYQDERAYGYVRNLVLKHFKICTLEQLRSRIIRYFCNLVRTKDNMHYMVLEYLLQEDKPLLYLDYILNNVDFLISWMRETMTHKLATVKGDMSWIQYQFEQVLTDVSPVASSTVQEISKATSMKEWCVNFSQFMSDQQGLQLDLKEAFLYHVSNFVELSAKIVDFCQSALFEETKENVQLPGIGDFSQTQLCLDSMLNCPFKDVIDNFLGCREKCPFCKAPCLEENVSDHNHQAFCHYPKGLAGKIWDHSNKLVEQSCATSVASKEAVYEKEGHSFLYKDYKRHFPFWFIPPFEPAEKWYWAWVFQNINEYCSKYYSCDPAEIPFVWSSEATLLRARAALKGEKSVKWLITPRELFELELKILTTAFSFLPFISQEDEI